MKGFRTGEQVTLTERGLYMFTVEGLEAADIGEVWRANPNSQYIEVRWKRTGRKLLMEPQEIQLMGGPW